MGTVGYEGKNWFTRLVDFAVRAGRSYQRFKDSLPGQIIVYYMPRRKRRE